jgi:hypothetical protein
MRRFVLFVGIGVCGTAAYGCAGKVSEDGSSVLSGEVVVVWRVPQELGSGHLNFAVTGPTTAIGSLDYDANPTVEFTIDLPPGTGYTLSLQTASSGGQVMCAGSESFSLPSTSPLTLAFDTPCAVPPDWVTPVMGITEACASWSSLLVSPAAIAVGETGHVTFSATAPLPAVLSYVATVPANLVASASSGPLDGNGNGDFDVTCVKAGEATIQLTFADGDGGMDMCDPTWNTVSTTITCDPSH